MCLEGGGESLPHLSLRFSPIGFGRSLTALSTIPLFCFSTALSTVVVPHLPLLVEPSLFLVLLLRFVLLECDGFLRYSRDW